MTLSEIAENGSDGIQLKTPAEMENKAAIAALEARVAALEARLARKRPVSVMVTWFRA
jgi:hypothetical protein